MWSILKRSGMLAAALIVINGATAQATTIEVKVPFPFVVRGQTLPAGSYLLERDGSDIMTIRGDHGTRGAAVVLTMPASGHDPAGDHAALTFTRHETLYRLTGVWDSEGDGRSVVTR